MKKIINILMLIVLACAACKVQAQTKPTEVTPDGYIKKPTYAYWLGTTSDTLTNAVSDSVIIRVKGSKTYDFSIQLYSDFVSGTAANLVKTYRSIDGATYTVTAAGDSIYQTSITADVLSTAVVTLDNFNYPYLKIKVTQTGTAVTVPKIYVYNKEN